MQCPTNGAAENSNEIINSSESAIHLDASCGALDGGTSGNNNTVQSNVVNDANLGLLKDSGVSGTVKSSNTFYNTGINDPPGNTKAQLPYKPVRP